MDTTKISDVKINPVVVQEFNPKTVKGYKYFKNPYNNIALIARTKSGKTTVIYRTLENTITPGTRVEIFCPSVKVDATYKKMIKMLKDKKCIVNAHDSFIYGKTSRLDNLVDDLTGKNESSAPPDKQGEIKGLSMKDIMFGNPANLEKPENPKKETKAKKEKKGKLSPEVVVIIDDLSTLCTHASVTRLLCKSRHMKMRVFVSIHSVNQLSPSSLSQVANFLCFPNLSDDKIIELADKVGLAFKSDTRKEKHLLKLYEDATSKKYNFLNIDTQRFEFRKNFSELYKI